MRQGRASLAGSPEAGLVETRADYQQVKAEVREQPVRNHSRRCEGVLRTRWIKTVPGPVSDLQERSLGLLLGCDLARGSFLLNGARRR